MNIIDQYDYLKCQMLWISAENIGAGGVGCKSAVKTAIVVIETETPDAREPDL
jgi:hypothetical protein